MKVKILGCVLVLLLVVRSIQAESIHFTFANHQITGTSTKYLEFDVLVNAGNDGTYLGDSQIYVNYDATKFGEMTKSKLMIPSDFKCEINWYGPTIDSGDLSENGCNDNYYMDNPSDSASIEREFIQPGDNGGLTKEEYENCLEGRGDSDCIEGYTLSVKVWK